MPTIPALTSISGEISAAPHNNNYGTIRTYVNDYAAFKDATNTFTTTNTFAAAVTISAGGLTVSANGISVSASHITCTYSGGGGEFRSVSGTVSAKFYADGSNNWGAFGTFSAHPLYFVSGGSTRGNVNASTGAWTIDSGLTVTAGGLTVSAGTTTVGALTSGAITATGNSTITGTLGGVTTLTCTTVTATNLGGTLTTAAQANVTSLGTLTALTVSGVSILRLTGGGAKIAEAASTGNFWVGPQSAVTTSATAGMLIMPGCNGTPTGSFSLGTNGFPMVIDYNTSKIWVNFNGTWRATAALT